jgi:predicted Zn-dependent protease with MMP-like domain
MKLKYNFGLLVLFLFVSILFLNLNFVEAQESKIPEWVRNIFVWYGQNQISEDELLSAIKFLVESKIIDLETQQTITRPELDLIRNSEYDVLVTYDVRNNSFELKEKTNVSFNLLSLQQDTEKHELVWNIFTDLIPEQYRSHINEFVVFTDGVEENFAFTERDINRPSKWVIGFDIIDMFDSDTVDENEVIITTIHEFGHILTLSSSQMTIESSLLDQNDSKFAENYAIKADECFPRYFAGDGCAFENSYIDDFYKQFWSDIYYEWDDLQYIEDDTEYYQKSDEFYEKYSDRFLNDYASTSLDEDIAESWTSFVLEDKPIYENTIAQEKIRFFYDYPELVELRNDIRLSLE